MLGYGAVTPIYARELFAIGRPYACRGTSNAAIPPGRRFPHSFIISGSDEAGEEVALTAAFRSNSWAQCAHINNQFPIAARIT